MRLYLAQGVFDVERGLLAVRDVEEPRGRAVLAWLLIRCIELDVVETKFPSAVVV